MPESQPAEMRTCRALSSPAEYAVAQCAQLSPLVQALHKKLWLAQVLVPESAVIQHPGVAGQPARGRDR